MALKCYKHKDEPEFDLNYIPTNDQKVNCSKDEDVCLKGYWVQDKGTVTARGCAEKAEMIKNGYWKDDGSECITTKDDYYGDKQPKREITACGCTTDYCNTSAFATPFHVLLLIALFFVTIFFI